MHPRRQDILADLDDVTNKPLCGRDDALAVVRTLRSAGHVAYFAGGCVRDLLLELQPKDYDVATDARPKQVQALFKKTQAAGQAFGVILVRIGKSVVEVATFRSDGVYTDGRRPDHVTFTTAQEDAQRRDFTINGLFLDPISNQIIDYVGGQEDLKVRILRAIGNPAARFGEDYLRMLRAVRFAARFNLTIEPATGAAIGQHAPKLAQVSPERIADELRAMLRPPSRVQAWELLWSLNLMPVILRHMPGAPSGITQGTLFPRLAPADWVPFALALATLALDAENTVPSGYSREFLQNLDIRQILQVFRLTLRLSNDETELMRTVLDLEPLLGEPPPTVAKMKRFLVQEGSRDARRLLDALLRTDPKLTRISWLQDQFAVLEEQPLAPPPLLNGDELIAAGYRPGPIFKKVIDAVYDAQLEGQVLNRAQAMAMARERLDRGV